MEATALSVGKSVLNGALDYANSALAEEVALQLGIHRDHAFIRGELEMMLAFLMAAHDERDEHKVVKTWVKQVRDVAYDVEDSLQDFAVRLGKPSWWRILRTLIDRHRVATRMKELRANVEDVSQRNVRYQLIKGSSSKAAITTEQANMSSTTMSGFEEAMRQRNKATLDLIRLIHNKKDEDLRVVAIWGTGNVLGETSIVRRAYDNLKRDNKFECQAWMSITHPFNPMECLQSIVRQLFVDSLHEAAKTQEKSCHGDGAHDLWRMGTMEEGDLIGAFQKYVSDKSFLIVLGNLSSKAEWDRTKAFFPNNKKGCRLIVCTEKVEVATLCVGQDIEIPELKQLSTDPTLFVFYEKGSQNGTHSIDPKPSSIIGIIDKNGSADEKRLTRMGTMVSAFKESPQLVGRVNEKSEIIRMVLDNSSKEFEVITIYGMGGLGKTTLVKYVYQSQELGAVFEKRACITIKRPFNPKELLSNLAMQLRDNEQEFPNNQQEFPNILEGKKYLVVLDDISSIEEWDAIIQHVPTTVTASRIIITTRVEKIAKKCSKDKNICKLETLEKEDAFNLFTEKVFGEITNLGDHYPELAEEAKLIVKKCSGLPLAIVTIGGFLAKQPKTPMEWRKLNEHLGAELETNQELGRIKDVLIKSYDGLPYHLKSCFLYMAIFPEDHNISRRRLVRRWIAEGYSSEVRGKSLKEIAESYFMELIDRSMVLPFRESIGSRNGIDSCQLHDLMREISISKSMEENLVLRMEEGCSLNTQGTVRHLSISSNWEGDQDELESTVDLSRIRSLTVFGKWRPFFISDKMRLLRVLDLESTSNLLDHHLAEIGKLVHLKYLSVRGCDGIYHLPDSLGNLKQLQTLDIWSTRIIKLPQCITKLRKLQYIRAGCNGILGCTSYEELVDAFNLPKLLKNKLCFCTAASIFTVMGCCNSYVRKEVMEDADSSRRDLCTWYCHVGLPFLARLADPGCVVVPRGLRKLKALHRLGIVNIARGKYILKEIKCMTQLRKLAVMGINKKNCGEFCSILACLSRLESLSVISVVQRGLHGCLDGVSSPPKSLQSLKLSGKLVNFPDWIGRLQNLVKLKLEWTELSEVCDTMQLLGKLPNLAILRLYGGSINTPSLTFLQEAFPSLMILDLSRLNLDSLKFEDGTAPKLQLLRLDSAIHKDTFISGLASLRCLKEVMYGGLFNDLGQHLRDLVAEHPKRPILKVI